LGIDKRWRKKVVKILKNSHPSTILDLATGTGDLAIEASLLSPDKITGIDISEEMLKIAQQKIDKKGLNEKILLIKGDGEHLPFSDNSFNAATIGFGIRNYENPLNGLKEIYRVLDNNGVLAVLEFSKPKKFPVKQIYNFYFKFLLPFFGRLISKSKTAYTYLPESVSTFPDDTDFLKLMTGAGFTNTRFHKLSFGIVSIYIGEKI
jgi:demethylmenaquinone methyltransferase/2-methoxy-6-polyprenyl-1,4-benzoquinol methylase